MNINEKKDINYTKHLSNFKAYTRFLIISTIITTILFLLAFYEMYMYTGDAPPIGLIFLFSPVLIMLYIILPLFIISNIYNLIRKRFYIYKAYFISTLICSIVVIIEFMIIHQ